MKVPVSWLRQYVPIEMPLNDLATRLSIASASPLSSGNGLASGRAGAKGSGPCTNAIREIAGRPR